MNASDLIDSLGSVRMLVIGDLMFDHYIWGDVQRISPEAPVPVVHAQRETYTAGGGANVALNLASLGASVQIAGTLGNDSPGNQLLALLAESGVNTDLCQADDSRPTIVKTRVIARTQQLCRIDHEAARSSYSLRSSPALLTAIENCDAVIFSDYAKGVISQALLSELLAHAQEHGKIASLDPKPASKLDFHGVSLITPNRHEALELAGLPEPQHGEPYPLEQTCRNIHERHAPDLLIITLGADGMAICREGLVECALPTEAREVFDVSGAGDTVIATLTAALAAGASSVEAAQLANQAAGIVVSKIGTARVDSEELRTSLKSNPAQR
jgi:rfaE bifunctional protein kinase chain/domain